MKNLIQEKADFLEVTAAADVDSGELIIVGNVAGVAVTDIASGAKGIICTSGIYSLAKATDVGSGGTIWAPAYFDATQKKVTAIASGNTEIGVFANTTLDAATSAYVLLGGTTGSKDEMVVSTRQAGAGSLATQAFFVAPVAMKVLKVSAVHSAAEATASSLTADVLKDTGTDAPGAGTSVLGSTKVNLKGTANTVQSPTLASSAATLTLAAGDRLALKPSAGGTEIAGLVVTVHLSRA